jgi:hypothetical protein
MRGGRQALGYQPSELNRTRKVEILDLIAES